jgi:triosephosphate isomerase
MNKTLAEVSSFQEGLSKTKTPSLTSQVDIGIAPQSIHLGTLKTKLQGSGLLLVSQNCGPERFGAHTGEISPESLLEMGVTTVILGHSERRHIYKEDNQQIFSRLKAAAES